LDSLVDHRIFSDVDVASGREIVQKWHLAIWPSHATQAIVAHV
jgi:hypothetical protein